MRTVDVLYGLPYILLVILFKIALERPLAKVHRTSRGRPANLVVLFLAIGLVSWLTMARVIRGQVLLAAERCRSLKRPSGGRDGAGEFSLGICCRILSGRSPSTRR